SQPNRTFTILQHRGNVVRVEAVANVDEFPAALLFARKTSIRGNQQAPQRIERGRRKGIARLGKLWQRLEFRTARAAPVQSAFAAHSDIAVDVANDGEPSVRWKSLLLADIVRVPVN